MGAQSTRSHGTLAFRLAAGGVVVLLLGVIVGGFVETAGLVVGAVLLLAAGVQLLQHLEARRTPRFAVPDDEERATPDAGASAAEPASAPSQPLRRTGDLAFKLLPVGIAAMVAGVGCLYLRAQVETGARRNAVKILLEGGAGDVRRLHGWLTAGMYVGLSVGAVLSVIALALLAQYLGERRNSVSRR